MERSGHIYQSNNHQSAKQIKADPEVYWRYPSQWQSDHSAVGQIIDFWFTHFLGRDLSDRVGRSNKQADPPLPPPPNYQTNQSLQG